jgi:hypothetical protein
MSEPRAYPTNLMPDPSFPRDLFDPRWRIPEVAAAVGRRAALHVLARGERVELVEPTALPAWPDARTDQRRLRLAPPRETAGHALRAGAINELHRRHAFGGQAPTVNFHAQAVCFGLDGNGAAFLRATVGRFGGELGNEAGLSVCFEGRDGPLAALLWTGEMDPPDDRELALCARAPRLVEVFARAESVTVSWYAHHHGRRPLHAPSSGASAAIDLFA